MNKINEIFVLNVFSDVVMKDCFLKVIYKVLKKIIE